MIKIIKLKRIKGVKLSKTHFDEKIRKAFVEIYEQCNTELEVKIITDSIIENASKFKQEYSEELASKHE